MQMFHYCICSRMIELFPLRLMFLLLLGMWQAGLIQSETLVFPSSILVLQQSTAQTTNQDATCNTTLTEAAQPFYRCTLSQSRTPIISDCDLGPNNRFPSEPEKEFYSLETTLATNTTYFWLAFEFETSRLRIDKVILFYYCTATSPLFWIVLGQFNRMTPVEIDGCDLSPNIMSNVTLPFVNASVDDFPAFIGLFVVAPNPSSVIYLSEVQFFSNQTTGPIELSVESDHCNSVVDVEMGQQTTLSCTAATVGGASCIEWEWSINGNIVNGSTSELTVSNISSTEQRVVSTNSLVVTFENSTSANYTCMAQLCGKGASKSAGSCWIFIKEQSGSNIAAILGGAVSAGIVVIVAIGLIITVLVACIIKRPWVKSKRPDPLRQPSGTQEIPMTPPPLIAEELPDIIHDVNVVPRIVSEGEHRRQMILQQFPLCERAPMLGMSDLANVLIVLSDAELTSKWKNIGQALKVTNDHLNCISGEHSLCLIQVVVAWLQRLSRHPEAPSWWSLVQAVADPNGGDTLPKAQRIADMLEEEDGEVIFVLETNYCCTENSQFPSLLNSFGGRPFMYDMSDDAVDGFCKTLDDVAPRWINIGVLLDVKWSWLYDRYVRDNDPQQNLRAMLHKWMDSGGNGVTLPRLVEAVDHRAGGNHPILAKEIIDKFSGHQ